ncbi:hypothetical protein BRD05_08430 [Halobacteriales archaeon QS_9_70_65]|nr:MAG: hypothetical protein BRD05_08430 [Halobacteriales archaeon QS_9_70_65]
MTRRRVLVLAVVVALSASLLGVQALTAGEAPSPEADGDAGAGDAPAADAPPSHTLVATQSYDGFRNANGDVRLVDRSGEVVWRYDPSNAWVFDAELTANDTVLVSMGESARAPGVDCPERYGGTPTNGTADPFDCVRNRVVEIDFRTKAVVWEYTWYDAFPTHHEVHDADRLPSGETAVADMGNDRAFTVDRSGTVTWRWNAADHIAEGTEFWAEHVPEDSREEFRRQGPESDWTHMNDVDRLENGNVQLSIRNFDVVLEVDPETNGIVEVIGEPDDHSVMTEQHNPMRVPSAGTVLIADSAHGGPAGADRVVEVDVETDEIVWAYDGTGSGRTLQWPRDVDRLPDGTTLVTDSRNGRVLEVDENGSVVWRYSMADENAIVYEADRVVHPDRPGYLPEEGGNVSGGRELESRTGAGPLVEARSVVGSWAGIVVPAWVGVVEILVGVVGLVALAGLAREGWRARG